MTWDRLYVNSKLDAIVADFVEQLEAGTPPWIRPYAGTSSLQLPSNRFTRRSYRGLNILILWNAMIKNNWEEPYFLTYNQCKQMQGHVKPGSKGTTIIYWGPLDQGEELDEETGEVKQKFVRKAYTVFNIEQCKGIESIPSINLPKPAYPTDRNPFVDEFVNRTGARIVYRAGSTPSYIYGADYIFMPPESDFVSLPEYYGTITHELIHWTGSADRLDRLQDSKPMSKQYAYEELVAELGAAFLCSWLSVPLHQVQHAEYLGSWVSVLKEHPSVLWSAASKATEAFEYLRELTKFELLLEEDEAELAV